MTNFNQWIIAKYKEWSADKLGHEGSMSKYARFLGVPYEAARTWLRVNGNVVRDASHINTLATIYGEEVYEVLGMEIPDSVWLSKLPAELKEPFTSALKEMDAIFIERSIDPDSAEGKRIAAEVLSRHGFMVKEIS